MIYKRVNCPPLAAELCKKTFPQGARRVQDAHDTHTHSRVRTYIIVVVVVVVVVVIAKPI